MSQMPSQPLGSMPSPATLLRSLCLHLAPWPQDAAVWETTGSQPGLQLCGRLRPHTPGCSCVGDYGLTAQAVVRKPGLCLIQCTDTSTQEHVCLFLRNSPRRATPSELHPREQTACRMPCTIKGHTFRSTEWLSSRNWDSWDASPCALWRGIIGCDAL